MATIQKYFNPNEMTMVEQKATRVRDERIDAVKYWLVMLVITAHVVMRKEFADSTSCAVLWNWLCTFDIPLFIFISGYFSRKKDRKDFLPSIWKLLEPLIIFHVIGVCFYEDSLSVRTILTPWFVLWYLLSLICWRLMLQIIPDRILNQTKLILITTFCISILAGFLPFDRMFSLQRTLSYMPFFFLGYYMKGKNLYLPDKYKPLCIVFLIGMLAILFFYPHRLNVLKHANPYSNIYGAAIRMFFFAIAVPMSVAFINVCPKTAWIARQGRLTMQYYIFHALLILPIMTVVGKLGVPMSFITAAIITTGIAMGLSLVMKIPYVKTLTNPSLFFWGKKK